VPSGSLNDATCSDSTYNLMLAWLPMRAETLKGHLDGLLLASLEKGPRHGYAIMEALRAGSGGQFDLPTGTIYPALRRLDRADLVRGTWSIVGGRQRRVYQLTPAGRRMLAAERGSWKQFSAAVTALMESLSWEVTS
jgi:PadR family transcriptional regulator, regulatory protein PadR